MQDGRPAAREWTPAAGPLSFITGLVSFEFVFVLFLFAGRFKADPRFSGVPFDMTAMLFVLSMLVGAKVLLERGFRVDRCAWRQWLLAAAFFTWVLASWLWSPGGEYATQKGMIAFAMNLWAMAGAGLIIAGNRARMSRLLVALLLFATWVAIEILMLIRAGGAIAFVSAFDSDYLGIGGVLSFAAIILVSFVLTARRPWWQIVPAMAGAVGFVAMMFPVGGRGPIVATGVAMLAGAFLAALGSRGELRFSARGFLAVTAGVAAIAFVVTRFVQEGGYALAAERFMVLTESGMGESAGVRWYYYLRSLSIIADNPWFGVGVGGWPVAMGFGAFRDYPHNLFLEVLAEQGLVGAVLLLVLLAYSAWLALRRNGALTTPSGFTVVLLAVGAFMSAMFSGDIGDNRVFFCVLGLCAASGGRSASGI